MTKFLFLLFLCIPVINRAQNIPVKLADKQIRKLNAYGSAKKKFVRYHKLVKRQRMRSLRKMNRVSRKEADSLFRAMSSSDHRGLPDSLFSLRDNLDSPSRAFPDSLFGDLHEKILPDSLLTVERGMLNNASPSDIAGISDALEVGKYDHGEFAQMLPSNVNPGLIPDELPGQALEEVTSRVPEYVKEEVGGQVISAAHERLASLMNKYKQVTNMSDLENAKKHTMLKGRTFLERLVVNANVTPVSVKPFSGDMAVQTAYRFNARIYAGLGINYRLTLSDSIRSSFFVSPAHHSYRLFANYDLIGGFFSYAEYQQSRLMSKRKDQNSVTWERDYFVGIGRKFLIHPKVYLTVTAMYNFNSDDRNPIHPRRLVIRTGFQLSELAILKKRPDFDPNR
jgi:hypothetical protein